MSEFVIVYLMIGALFTGYKLIQLMLKSQLRQETTVLRFLYDALLIMLVAPLALAHDILVIHIEKMTGQKWERPKRIWEN